MIGIEFGAPKSLLIKGAWSVLHAWTKIFSRRPL